jgi:hypothetical protein
VLELTNGYLLGIPITALPDLAGATSAQLAGVELSGAGMALRVPDPSRRPDRVRRSMTSLKIRSLNC